jgi:hypothetical protein
MQHETYTRWHRRNNAERARECGVTLAECERDYPAYGVQSTSEYWASVIAAHRDREPIGVPLAMSLARMIARTSRGGFDDGALLSALSTRFLTATHDAHDAARRVLAAQLRR